MFKALTPILALMIAVGLGFSYVKPEVGEIKKIQTEAEDYIRAIDKANELKTRLEELTAKRSNLDRVNLERLETILPNQVDEVSLIKDIDALARTYNMRIAGISVADAPSEQADSRRSRQQSAEELDPALAVAPAAQDEGEESYSGTDISFSVEGTYEEFRSFLAGLEQSLVFMDIITLGFSVSSESELTVYDLKIRTYAFNPISQ